MAQSDKRCAVLAPFDMVPLGFSIKYPRCDVPAVKMHDTHRHTRRTNQGTITWKWKGGERDAG